MGLRHAAIMLQLFVAMIILFLSTSPSCSFAVEDDRQVYVVYMGDKPNDQYELESHHISLLEQILEGSSARESLVYSYSRSFNGFAARLTTKEQQKLANREGIVSVFPSKTLSLHTTRSWDFLGFHETAAQNPGSDSGIIVGMLDSGVWPESASFISGGLGALPSKWKGTCQNFTCNNKIIGARYYRSAGDPNPEHGLSARDYEGHGTHTASTVAGVAVKGVGLYGLAKGTARGGMPSARVAVYKVCWSNVCTDHDILAGFDDAIADGVDIISASMGKPGAGRYVEDSVAIGSFHAMKAGVLTSASAGNDGQQPGTVVNTAPWMLTVAASTIDRRILDKLVTGDQDVTEGNSINAFETEKASYPFIYAGNAAAKGNQPGLDPSACDANSLDEDTVRGKIVLCNAHVSGEEPLRAGARGAVMVGYDELDVSWQFPLPAMVVDARGGDKLRSYINSTANPTANIQRSSSVADATAPVVASFSGRGPNRVVPDILKPDISAPGLNILSAWSPAATMTGYAIDKRSVFYNLMSGTSASCPHATGAAAYVKSFHPDFSPAALLSALITTARPMDPSNSPGAELAYGAGQIDPVKAADPGLVYDAGVPDYVHLLCSSGYSSDDVRLISGGSGCDDSPSAAPKDLNRPSMASQVTPDTPFVVGFTRTVTNVGTAEATYSVSVESLRGNFAAVVTPTRLSFGALQEKQSYSVTVASDGGVASNETASASVVWSDGVRAVRSPLVIHTGYME